jgi:glycine/D-amino acid oxidase-like deaminating enzyme
VLLADANESTLHAAAETMTADGYHVLGQQVDVSSQESVSRLARKAVKAGSVTQVVHTAGLSPSQASASAVLAVDLLGVALVLEEFGRVVAAGGAGVVISSMAGQLAQPLTAEQYQALTRTPAAELLNLPFASPQQVTDSGVAYAIAKRANQVRVEAASLAWNQRGATRCAANRGRCCPDAQQTNCRDTGALVCSCRGPIAPV